MVIVSRAKNFWFRAFIPNLALLPTSLPPTNHSTVLHIGPPPVATPMNELQDDATGSRLLFVFYVREPVKLVNADARIPEMEDRMRMRRCAPATNSRIEMHPRTPYPAPRTPAPLVPKPSPSPPQPSRSFGCRVAGPSVCSSIAVRLSLRLPLL